MLQFDSSNCPPLLNPTRQIHEMQSFSLLPIIPKISEHNFQFLLLHKYVPKGLYVLLGSVFPQVLESSFSPPVPNPTLELQEVWSSSLLPRMPILALERFAQVHSVLNPCLLQLLLKEAPEAISENHVLRPNEVERYCPSAIGECREPALFLI